MFINRLKYAEQKTFCICIHVYKFYEKNDYDKIFEALSTSKNKKLKLNNILIEKYKDIIKSLDLKQNYFSRTSTGIDNFGDVSFRIKKWLAFYDRSYYVNIIYYDLMRSVLKILNEIYC